MSPAHAHALYLHASSVVHRLPAQCKVAAHLLFVAAVVATPREAVWAFAAYAAALLALVAVARLPVRVVRRMAIELPFVAFAVLLPFVGTGDRIEVVGMALSSEGLWAAWNILAKATLGVGASVILAATTTVQDLLTGLERIGVPRAIVAIAGFMVRYLDLVAAEMHRMRVARLARGYDPRWLWQARAVAAGLGSLFVRSYERGERVYLAMASRGYDGSMPTLDASAPRPAEWATAMSLPMLAAALATTALVVA